ncbi:PhnD/SsuA/transferrin family substrate-binding protein [Mameliella sediminis]|uniref:PhnD/SsuA/transferrin family substrate-binding protein n=1 Tax=Mameliella sediminis TaxID=2836866 RepID=UPI001C46C0BE|nr:PhnD/SsuA/transferrin family substrate-binding protein [Mameliella sediminis]MBV7395403.1 PhnD/SsuA/transferrin family substrate-binding protein [Mameliella sediminis]
MPMAHRFPAWFLCALILFGGLLPGLVRAQEPEVVRIGVLAHRGWADQQTVWTPLAEYLQPHLGNRVARLVPVTLTSAGPLVNAGGLDFLVTNPGHYIQLAETFPMSVLATRKRRLSDGSHATQFGSAVLVRADSGLTTLADLRDQRIGAVAPQAFGGFQMAWFEAQAQGVDLLEDSTQMVFLGFPQDAIARAVLDGDLQAGIVRSGLLERLQAEGVVPPDALSVLNANVTYTYPEAVSTRLYPEWPFVALAGTSAELRDTVALALLQSGSSDLVDTWGAPVSYHDARALAAAFANRQGAATSPPGGGPAWIAWGGAMIAAILALAALLGWLFRRSQSPADAAPPLTEQADSEVPLTRRESQVLGHIGAGHSTKEIAAALGISPKTVEFHRANLLRKYDARSSAQLIALAQRQLSPQESET